MEFKTGKHTVELVVEEVDKQGLSDSLNNYQKVYFDKSEYDFPTKIGVKVFQNKNLIKSVLLGSIGGGTGIHATSQIIEDDRILICCSDTVFCLSVPDLDLIWKTQADQATCFEIFRQNDSYIIHGEMVISKLDASGNIMWQQTGGDIFTTEKGTDDFEITEKYIKATDWENRIYKFDFDGELLE